MTGETIDPAWALPLAAILWGCVALGAYRDRRRDVQLQSAEDDVEVQRIEEAA